MKVRPNVLFSIYLCIFGCMGSSLLHMGFLYFGERALLSSCLVWASCCGFSLVAEHGLCGVWASVVAGRGLLSTGSVVVLHRLSCSLARGIFLDQGLDLCLLHRQADSLPQSHQRSPLLYIAC